jgi:hypothetical protein
MEQGRFDDLAKCLATRQSRRRALARLSQAVTAAAITAIGIGRFRADAQILPCAEDGCRCQASVPGSCIAGLVCCADNPNLPGGPGTCVPPSLCYGGLCSGDGVACPPTCARGANCLGCCAGYCGFDGACGPGPCRSAGCDCITGTLNPCDEGLACCPTIEGLPGGPGICAPRGICG